jgi:hypothetical protein
MDHGKGAGTTEPASVGPAGDAGPIKPGGTKTPSTLPEIRPHSRPSLRCFDAFSKFKLYNCVVARGTWAPGTKEKSTNNFTTFGTRGKAKGK